MVYDPHTSVYNTGKSVYGASKAAQMRKKIKELERDLGRRGLEDLHEALALHLGLGSKAKKHGVLPADILGPAGATSESDNTRGRRRSKSSTPRADGEMA